MASILIFSILQLLVSGYALWRGGAPERWVALLLVAATVASILTPFVAGFTLAGVNWPMLNVDSALLLGLVLVAMFADRFWPMWIAALQLVSIGVHAVRAYDLAIVPYAYWWMIVKLAYPMLAILVIGTYRHTARLRLNAPEYDWSLQRWRHGSELGAGDRP